MPSDEQLAGFVVFPFAFLGVLANWTVAILIRKLPSLKNSFGSLTASQSIADAIHSSVFAFYFAPMLIFNLQLLKTYSSIIGHVLLVVYDISVYSHLCISLNRFCSIVAPIKYDTIFSQINTKVFIFFSWIVAVIPSFYLYIYNDCRLTYADGTFIFQLSSTPVCGTIAFYVDFLRYITIVSLIVVIDIVTVSKVRSYKAKAFVFACELTTYFLIMPRIDPTKQWLRFFLSTFAWVCVHMLDGIITLISNKEFTQTIFKRVQIHDSSNDANRNVARSVE